MLSIVIDEKVMTDNILEAAVISAENIDDRGFVQVKVGFWAAEDANGSTEDGIDELIGSVEDVFTFQRWTDLEIHPDWNGCMITKGDESITVEGYFIAVRDDGDRYTLITNAKNASSCVGLSCMLTIPLCGQPMKESSPYFQKVIKEAAYDLRKVYEKRQEPGNGEPGKANVPSESRSPMSFNENLFQSGVAAVACSSEEEYREFQTWLSKNGYHPDGSLDARCWEVFRKYIMCRPGTKDVYAYHRLKGNVDCVLSPEQLEKTKKEG